MLAAIACKGEILGDRKLFIEEASSRPRGRYTQEGQKPPPNQPSNTIFIGGLGYFTRKEVIHDAFSKMGEILEISLPLDPNV